jgi:NUDIX domain
MWEVPQTSLESRGQADLVHELRQRHGLDVVLGPLLVQARHAITYRRIRVEGYRARLGRRPPSEPDRFRWATPAEARDLPVSSMTRKLLSGLANRQLPLDL